MGQGFRRFVACLLTGHDDSLRWTDGSLYLRCWRCQRRTVGWWWDVRPLDFVAPERIESSSWWGTERRKPKRVARMRNR